jgi:two-component system, cell cycle sensor histidine kinase and response regulator CckA
VSKLVRRPLQQLYNHLLMNLFLDDFCPEKVQQGRCSSLTSILSLLGRMPALLWATDPEGRFTSLTGAGLELAGVSARDYAGQPLERLFLCSESDDRPRRAHLAALVGEAASFETEINGRDLQAHLEPLRGSDGAIAGVLGVALDLTDRTVAERALRLSEHSYRSLIEEAPYAICRCTVGGQLLQANRAMLEMLGYGAGSEAELLLRDLPLIFANGAFQRFRSALLEGGAVQGIETSWLLRDGNEIQVMVSGRAIRDHAGEVSHLDVLAEDVTDKKRLEEQLIQAQKMQAVGQLAGGVAHDFNNLLTVIGGHVEMLMNSAADPALHDRLSAVKQASDRAAELTRQLLAFSRRQVLQSKVVNLNEVVQRLIAMLNRLIKENVELTFLPARDLGFVRIDPYQIEQVLINLTVNAQDAMPKGGQLTIETRNVHVPGPSGRYTDDIAPGDYVLIVVLDTGHGMEREVQARIFEPFFTTKKMGQGTGLGLSMAYGVVQQSGGHIRLESKVGEGTTFRIYLPRVAGSLAGARPMLVPPTLPRGTETILLAEDESSVRELIGTYLQGLGYHVLTASNGVAGIAVAKSYTETIHLLLSDFVMPKLGGRELAAELKKITPQLKVIFLSGYAGHAVTAKDLDLPDARFLPKPLSLEALAKTVRDVLDT